MHRLSFVHSGFDLTNTFAFPSRHPRISTTLELTNIRRLFHQPDELKGRGSRYDRVRAQLRLFAPVVGPASPLGPRDMRDGFAVPPLPMPQPGARQRRGLRWEGTAHLDGSKDAIVGCWLECLAPPDPRPNSGAHSYSAPGVEKIVTRGQAGTRRRTFCFYFLASDVLSNGGTGTILRRWTCASRCPCWGQRAGRHRPRQS